MLKKKKKKKNKGNPRLGWGVFLRQLARMRGVPKKKNPQQPQFLLSTRVHAQSVKPTGPLGEGVFFFSFSFASNFLFQLRKLGDGEVASLGARRTQSFFLGDERGHLRHVRVSTSTEPGADWTGVSAFRIRCLCVCVWKEEEEKEAGFD